MENRKSRRRTGDISVSELSRALKLSGFNAGEPSWRFDSSNAACTVGGDPKVTGFPDGGPDLSEVAHHINEWSLLCAGGDALSLAATGLEVWTN